MEVNDSEDNRRTTLSSEFLSLGLPPTARILDLACGTGVVAEELLPHGYDNVDGLDPIKGYLETAKSKNLYRRVYAESVDPAAATSIPDGSYDAVVCCAGFFQGLISPRAFPEIVRITKPGGLIMWNICVRYEECGKDFELYDDIVSGLVRDGSWSFHRPVKKVNKMVFTDCGAAYLAGYVSSGVETEGYVYVMKKKTGLC